MSTISLKGERGDDPWLTLDYDNAADLRAGLEDLLGVEFPAEPVTIPHLVAIAQAWYRRNYALSQVVTPAVQAAPAVVVPAAQAVPATVTPITAAPSIAQAAQAGEGGLRFWETPDPKKPQYNVLAFTWDFIPDANTRNALNAALKASNGQTWAKPLDTNASPWVYSAKKDAEPALRAIFAQHGIA